METQNNERVEQQSLFGSELGGLSQPSVNVEVKGQELVPEPIVINVASKKAQKAKGKSKKGSVGKAPKQLNPNEGDVQVPGAASAVVEQQSGIESQAANQSVGPQSENGLKSSSEPLPLHLHIPQLIGESIEIGKSADVPPRMIEILQELQSYFA